MEKVVISLEENNTMRQELVESMDSIGLRDLRMHVVRRHPSGGNFGCATSHLEVIRHAYDQGSQQLLVFEDDARPFGSSIVLQPVMEEVPPDWDVVYLGYMPYPLSSIKSIPHKRYLHTCSRTWMSHAYIISRACMKVVLSNMVPGTKHKDHYDSQLHRLAENRYVLYPMLFYQDDRRGVASNTHLITNMISLKDVALAQQWCSYHFRAFLALFVVMIGLFMYTSRTPLRGLKSLETLHGYNGNARLRIQCFPGVRRAPGV